MQSTTHDKEETTLMDRRRFLYTSAGAVTALWLEGCSRSRTQARRKVVVGDRRGPALAPGEFAPSPRPTIRMGGGDVGTPTPFNSPPPVFGQIAYVYDTLLMSDNQGNVMPWLASRYERSSDGLRYTFELRDNLTWHDGKPLTADDVVFTFDYYAAQNALLPPYVIFRPDNVAKVRALGARTVEFQLDRPVVTFVTGVAASIPIIPGHIWSSIKDAGAAQGLEVLVGSGPYRLESYSRGQGAYLYTANDNFFLGKPFVKRIELRPVEDALTALVAKEIDTGGAGFPGATDDVLAPFGSDPFAILEGRSDFVAALYWNQTKGGALADVRFRRACAMAIDRNDIVKRLAAGRGEPGNPGFLPQGHRYHVEVEQYPFDPEGANRLLDEAGYVRANPGGVRKDPEGKALRFKTLVAVESAPVVELVAASLKVLGIELELEPAEILGILANNGNYEMAVLIYGGPSGDPDYLRGVYSSRVTKTFQSARGYVNTEFDDLADKQLVTLDEAERKALLARMQQIVAGDVPMLHLYYPTPYRIYNRERFDQWSDQYSDKQVLVTGARNGSLEIRPIKEE